MTKQASTPEVNYPDVLGGVTGGARVNIDLLQVAAAVRPTQIHAGRTFDALILLQNTANIEMDAVVKMTVPDKDLNGKPGRVVTKVTKPLRIGLRPGEVGYASLPVITSHQTAPGEGYSLEFDVQVEQKGRNPTRVRDANGGAPFKPEGDAFLPLQGLKYSAEVVKAGLARALAGSNRSTLIVPFIVLPAAVSDLPEDRRPGYITLWSEADYRDPASTSDDLKSRIEVLLPQFNRYMTFFPLLKYTQERFEGANYRLWAGEAIMVAKLLALVLEMGSPVTVTGQDETSIPRWYTRLTQVLSNNPALATPENIPALVTQDLYADLIYDGAMLAFSTLSTVTNEDFGAPAEIADYTERLVEILTRPGGALEITRAYLPLILGGLVLHSRVMMPQEQARDTVQLFARATQHRATEQNDQNSFVFEITDDLIRRAEA